jgi:glycopeptide antibiotics resistance protein
MENRHVNLIPFSQAISSGNFDFGETIMNVVIFVPLGIYAGVLFRKWTFWKNILFFLVVTLIIEAVQFFFRVGAFDTTDTISNTLGGMIGLMIFKGIEIMFKEPLKAQKSINIVASVGTFLMILFLFLLKTNNLGVKYQ